MERRARTALVAGSLVLLVLLVLALALRFALSPERVAGLVLGQVGRALDLEITAAGAAEYRLRGTPPRRARPASACRAAGIRPRPRR